MSANEEIFEFKKQSLTFILLIQYEAINKIRSLLLQFGKPGCTEWLRVDFTLQTLCHLGWTECLGPPCPGAQG